MQTGPARPSAPWALLQDGPRFLRFQRPEDVVEARSVEGIPAALERLDAALARGRWVAGFLGYEAAGAFGFTTRPPDPDGPPLLWLGVFEAPAVLSPAVLGTRENDVPPSLETWRPGLAAPDHAVVLDHLHDRIAAGDTYQVNFTFPLTAPLQEDPFALFSRLVAAQRPRHAGFVDIGRFAVASASPELFFRLEEGSLTTRPMKGTAPRGPTLDADARRAEKLHASEKNRAENLMIVDMLRNDLGRVAEIGTVAVPSLFEIERYPTLLQMTSTVTARTSESLAGILTALFPCASITGAPKKRTMEIIAASESTPRGVYTGSVGWASPDGSACFNVAIRTAVADREAGEITYGVGSGIVADSEAASEYAECLLKARILEERPFALLETLAYRPGEGYRWLEGHLSRLRASARFFVLPLDEPRVASALDRAAAGLSGPGRVRLLLHEDGRVTVESRPLPPPSPVPPRVGLAGRPVDATSVWVHHTTTRREIYDDAVASRPDCDDVLLWNTRGEVTESSIANVLVEVDGERVTPPVSSGLLAGVERSHLLAEKGVRVEAVRASDLARGQRIWLANSVRGLYEALFVG